MKILDHSIQTGARPFVIAEIGANHNGDMALAKRLIDAAADAGADCVKFQSWSKSSIFAQEVYAKDKFLADGRDEDRADSLEATVERYSLSHADHRTLAAYCAANEVIFASSPFSPAEVDMLVDELDVPFVKVASMDVTNPPFLAYIAAKGRPVVLSTGLASLSEIAAAVDILGATGCTELALLHCVSQYPPDDANLNLRNIDMLREAFPQCQVGYSDHSMGTAIPLAAIARGATIIEKHFTLDRDLPGWDHAVSAVPFELTEIVTQGRRIVTALGSHERRVSEKDLAMRSAFRRSIVAARPIAAGHVIERADLDFKRPGRGFPPTALDMVVGRTARRDIAADELLEPDAF